MRGREIIKRLRPPFTSSCVLIPGNDLEAKEQNRNWICLLGTRDGITQVPAMLLETGSLGSSQQGLEAAIQEHMHTREEGKAVLVGGGMGTAVRLLGNHSPHSHHQHPQVYSDGCNSAQLSTASSKARPKIHSRCRCV